MNAFTATKQIVVVGAHEHSEVESEQLIKPTP
jgi:hypothetical protein